MAHSTKQKYFTEEERKQAAKENNAKWRREHREYIKQKKRERYINGAVPHRLKERELILNAYGRKCAECGIDNVLVLDLDHKFGNGAQHRKAVGSWRVYTDVIKRGFPDDFRLLCKNCNWLAWLKIKPPTTTL